MTLDEWRVSQKLTMDALGRRLGVAAETAGRYCNNKRIPARAVMARIVAATGGAVQPNDFYQLPQEARSATGETGKEDRLPPDTLVSSKGDPT
ncbi:MAG: helix-turn-helix transcriptional regulator [Rhodospirillales bacterium]|nr:helix-turn-helix transcriptional regulator [Rhodospirillales bacterium]MDH3912421.1 helix-turn-helix transcriptional regulator [Rhodospirillales bacterium]